MGRMGGSALNPYLQALRPHQWLKNVLVFVPLLTAQKFDSHSIWMTVAAFCAFCAVASAVYVVNDLSDIEADRKHPTKRHRPFASGALNAAHGRWMAAGLLIFAAVLGIEVGWQFLAFVTFYLLSTTAYTFWLKRYAVMDICLLAGFYTLRIIAGGAALHLYLTVWLLAFSVFFFLSLAALKRLAELLEDSGPEDLNAIGRGYRRSDSPLLSQFAVSSGYISILVLALYISTPAVFALYTSPSPLWGICLVLIYWIGRMTLVTHRGEMDDDPLIFAVRDKMSLLCLALALVAVTWALFF